MKKLVVILIFGLLYIDFSNLSASEYNRTESNITYVVQQRRVTPLGGGYSKDNFSVYYRGRKIEDAAVSSFRYIDDGYAKDNWTVFFRGKEVEDASTSSFNYLGGGYAKDNWTVFYLGKEVEDAAASSFEYTENGYGRDNWNVFSRGKVVNEKNIKSIGGGYSKDNFAVYYQGHRIEGASENSFEYIERGYAKDNWKVFYKGMVIEGASVNSFEYLEDGYADAFLRRIFDQQPQMAIRRNMVYIGRDYQKRLSDDKKIESILNVIRKPIHLWNKKKAQWKSRKDKK